MPTPVIHTFPVRRPGFIMSATWVGADDDLTLECGYVDQGGVPRSIVFETRNTGEGRLGEICLPTSSDVADLGPNARDILVAHLRMACMVAGLAVPGSKEFTDALIQADSNNLQTAIGTVKVTAVAPVDDQCVDVEFQKGNGPKRTYRIDHGELNDYVFVPQTQLRVIAGSVEKQFPNAVHDYPTTVLSATDKASIATYVLGLSLWV